jgi:hypothetical protein
MNDALALVGGYESDLVEQFPWASADRLKLAALWCVGWAQRDADAAEAQIQHAHLMAFLGACDMTRWR